MLPTSVGCIVARMDTIASRITAAREKLGLNQSELGRLLGVSPQSVQAWEAGKNIPRHKRLVEIAQALGINPSSLIDLSEDDGAAAVTLGTGSVKTSAAIVMEMLKGKKLRPDQQQRIEQAVSDTLEDKPAAQADNVITADFSRRPIVGDEIRIAHYDVQGAMGGGKVVHDFPEMFRDVTVSQQHLRELGITYKDPLHLKLITGAGQSMEPTIQDKDPLIADASIREFTGDGIYAFAWHGHFYIKRLQISDAEHYEMISDNPKHKDRIVRIDETFIQARVLLVWNAKRV